MTRLQLVRRGLTYYWRTNLAVIAGVATAVSVLAGALLVGDSVRGSLRALVLERLGRTDQVIASGGFFREALADDIRSDTRFAESFRAIAPLIVARGLVTHQDSGRRAGQVAVYGVDDRFWQFHGVSVEGPGDREALVSPALAAQLALAGGDAVLVRVQRPTDVPIESLHGRKDDLGRTLRLTVSSVLPPPSLGEFSLDPRQGEVMAVFVPLSRLQREIEAEGRVNTLLVAAGDHSRNEAASTLEALVRAHATITDLGLGLTPGSQGELVLGADAGLIDDRQAEAAQRALAALGIRGRELFTYLANTLRVGDREVPYSLVTAIERITADQPPLAEVSAGASRRDNEAGSGERDVVVLTDWAARDLRAGPGDALTMEYYVWEEPGRLVTRSAEFTVAGIVPLAVGERDYAPTFPGISDSPSLDDWDPPFPVDLRRVRPVDEAFWNEHRTTPKAYIPLEAGRRVWRSRYGALTSIRFAPPEGQSPEQVAAAFTDRLRSELDPLASGLAVRDTRGDGLAASRGATDFGEYFVYFSFFLVVSALLLAALFFKLGVEQRAREVGLLRAVGLKPRDVRRLFLAEGLLLAAVGSAVGLPGAVGYAWLLMYGLRTWWVEAVGTTALTLHVSPLSLAAGAAGGIAAAGACIWWTLRGLRRVSARSLLAGDIDIAIEAGSRRSRLLPGLAMALAVAGGALLVAGAAGVIDPAGAFFGAAFALMGSAFAAILLVLRRRPRHTLVPEPRAVAQLGLRNAAYRPGRSVLSMAVIASATFILISVDAFRRGAHADTDRRSGVGGYSVMVTTLLPVAWDPNTPDGREALNLFDLDESVRFEPLRVRPGDDASCLNLYAPRNPRIAAPRDVFLEEGRFAFAGSLAATDAERENPWLLLRQTLPDGAVPVIADANSMTYVLHKSLGDDIVIEQGVQQIRLRLVASLRDSIFQGELLMSEDNFLELFPEQQGFQMLLAEAPIDRAPALVEELENALADHGADAALTSERLAEFHRVENTYLSTFQTLGGLGLLLGTVGLAAVLLRNVLERRRELALLGAVGYRRRHFLLMLLAENVALLAGGLAIGIVCAALAVAPAAAERGARVPISAGGALLAFAVLTAGLLSSILALRAATRAPLLVALRSE